MHKAEHANVVWGTANGLQLPKPVAAEHKLGNTLDTVLTCATSAPYMLTRQPIYKATSSTPWQ